MNEVVEWALREWGWDGADVRLVAARENAVYEVSLGKDRYAMRLHRQGYRSDVELHSELHWMTEVERKGLSVPAPVSAQNGKTLCIIDGVQIDVLTWLAGQTMADALPHLPAEDRQKIFFKLGKEMARLHEISDAWKKPPNFYRAHWNLEGLLGKAPLWNRFWENQGLSSEDRELFEEFRAKSLAQLTHIGASLDYGLIHADLVPNNVLIDRGTLRLIDFDDGGFGFRLFEVATALLKHRATPEYPMLRESLIDGYRSIRPLDITHLNLFLALRAATYVGWNITRIGELDGSARNERFIRVFRDLAAKYCNTSR